MIINLLMSFAQFEREMTADRVRDPVHTLRSAFGYPQKRIRFFGGYAVADKLITLPLWSEQHALLRIE